MKSWFKHWWQTWRTVIFTTGADGLLAIFGLLSGVMTARLLLPEGKGELTAILLWPNLFTVVGSLGLGHAIVYYAGQHKEDIIPF